MLLGFFFFFLFSKLYLILTFFVGIFHREVLGRFFPASITFTLYYLSLLIFVFPSAFLISFLCLLSLFYAYLLTASAYGHTEVLWTRDLLAPPVYLPGNQAG
uniref:Uncharacterized protein n=1 Tax=Cacopsylla melanoneura TaxID=428564 RepID=A0A8D9DVJ4_9HEMI